MRMVRMYNARVFLFRIPVSEWTERHSIHSAPRGGMNRMLQMKIQDGRRREERCGFKYVSTGDKIRLHFWTQWNIAFNFIVPNARGFFQWCFVQENGNLANDCRRHEEKWLLFLLFIYEGNCCDNGCNGSLFVGRHICYAMFTHARTAHLDGRFFMQTIRIIPSIPYQPFLFQNCG